MRLGEVLPARVLERVLEDLELVEGREGVVIGRHREHVTVLDVEEDLPRLAVLLDERMKRVAARHPRDESRVGRERHDRVALDRQVLALRVAIGREQRVDEAEELQHRVGGSGV